MAKLATCPGCNTQLALPEDATLSDRARCPRCSEEFLLMETVQFSIPTAEILPPVEAEAEAESAAETTTPAEYPLEPFAHETASDVDESSEVAEPETLPMSATLSDWEARLKRAIDADLGDEKDTSEETLKRFQPREFTPPSLSNHVEPARDLEDFSISDSDLEPESGYEPAEAKAWSAEDAYYPEEESTEDRILADEVPETELPVSIRTHSVPSKNRKRSLARSLAGVCFGMIGIPLGLYALLWLRGPAGDMLHIADYLPSFMLPASFGDLNDTELLVQQDESVTPDDIVEHAPVVQDPAVAPASAEMPLYRGPTFTLIDAQEFSELMATADELAPQLSEGDLKSKDSVAQKGQAYMALCRLAEKCSYLYQPGLTMEESAKAAETQQLFRTTLKKENVQRDLPQIALRWWQFPERPTPGMVFTGRVERLQNTEAGTLVFVSLGTEGIAPPIPVLMAVVEHAEGDTIGVVGSIMANPNVQIPALDVTLPSVVIAHYSFPLEAMPQ